MLLAGLLLLFSASIFGSGQAWILEASKTRVAKKLTTNITISCQNDGKDNDQKPLKEVSRIRLLKLKRGMEWDTVARISEVSQKIITTFGDVQTSGFAGKSNESFLTIHFALAIENSIGLFKCEVDGFDTNDELQAVETNQVNIYERGVSLDDLFALVLGLEGTESTDHTSDEFRLGLLEKAVRLLEGQGQSRAKAVASVQLAMTKMTNDLKKTNSDLVKAQGQIQAQLDVIKKLRDGTRDLPWPEGAYALLNTSNGCPDSETFAWEASNVRISTESSAANKDDTSSPIHLSRNPFVKKLGGNVFSFWFCSKTTSSAGPAWPKGRYCFNNFIMNQCPTNFASGDVTFDREDLVYKDISTNMPSFSFGRTISKLQYCCRQDGDADHPILLPTQAPFYLYRFKGKCQEVIGMNVSPEWVYLDTKEALDAYSNGNHPDGHLKDIRLELCYYSPKP